MNRQNTKSPGSAQCSALGESFGNEISKSVSFANASESVKLAHTYTPPGPSEILASAALWIVSRMLARRSFPTRSLGAAWWGGEVFLDYSLEDIFPPGLSELPGGEVKCF